MARIPQSFIDQLLARVDIIDVIDKFIPLKKTGANYSARCPFHNEKTPSFSVNQSKQFYYCFGCGASGNAIGFLMNYDHLTFIEAIQKLAQQVGMEVPLDEKDQPHNDQRKLYDIMQRANEFYQQQLREHPQASVVVDYLKNRGLTGKIAKQFQLGFAPSGWENLRDFLRDVSDENLLACGLLSKNDQGKMYDRFRDRLMFPIRDRQGRTIGFGGRVLDDSTPKYLNSPETAIFHKGSELYGLYEAQQTKRQWEELIVVEGYMDVIALAQFDIHNAVATLGTATTKQNAERLFRYTDNVIFCFDGDTAGRTAAWRALENILPLVEDGLNVRFMFLPEGEDPDTLVRRQGTAAFQQATKAALSLATFLLKHLSEACDLATVEGRSRLTKHAEPYIKQIPGVIIQQLMIEELAKRTQMDAAQLRSLWGLKAVAKTASKARPTVRDDAPATPMQQAISILLQAPDLIQHIPNIADYKNLALAGADLLNELLEKLHIAPKLSTGVLLEHWDDPKTKRLLAKLAMRENLIPPTGLAAELQGLLARLQQLDREQKLSIWQQRMAAGELTQAEKQQYQALLKQQKKL